ncbi:hypothetical protein [Thalassovita sp.]|jgi:hypothetical protein|uniref:hypothetical protein n=1 Tax=Thalassovita sp. TaxID=1979401 RepID=UPI003B5BB501
MKKFTIAAAAALTLAAAAPAVADTATTDDPFVSTQGALNLGGPNLLLVGTLVTIVAVASGGDT